MKKKLLSLVAITLTAVAACSAPPADDAFDETASTSNELTENDWNRAVSFLGGLSYIPWGWTNDGCYARALYYTMNLAAEGIASNHVYIVAQDGYGLGSTGAWTYHVAPLVSKDATNELYVLDPIYSSQALRLDSWTVRQSRYAPGSAHAPAIHVMPGNSFGQRGAGPVVSNVYAPDVASFREPASFSDMPKFSIANINAACDVMHGFIDAENKSNKNEKHITLSRESRRLAAVLESRGKLDGAASSLSASCQAYAPELAACPADNGVTNPTSRDCCLASAHFCWSDTNHLCNSPGTLLNGKTCGAGGNWHAGSSYPTTPTNPPAGSPGTSCPADNASNNPGSRECCLASHFWCWSGSQSFCANPGFSHVVNGASWTCGANGEWTQ